MDRGDAIGDGEGAALGEEVGEGGFLEVEIGGEGTFEDHADRGVGFGGDEPGAVVDVLGEVEEFHVFREWGGGEKVLERGGASRCHARRTTCGTWPLPIRSSRSIHPATPSAFLPMTGSAEIPSDIVRRDSLLVS